MAAGPPTPDPQDLAPLDDHTALWLWHKQLTAVVELPAVAYWRHDGDELFVLLEEIYSPTAREEHERDLLCRVRLENRPVLVQLSQLSLIDPGPAVELLQQYEQWIAQR